MSKPRHHLTVAISIVALVAAGSGTATASATSARAADQRVWTTQTSPLSVVPVKLVAGQAASWSVTDLSSGADPVLHLLDPSGVQVASEGGDTSLARLRYVPSVGGMYQLVIRALSAGTAGTGTLVTTTGATEQRLPVSFVPWQPIPLTGLRAGERIASVPQPAVTPQQHRLLLLTADGSGVEVMRTGPDGAEIAMSSATGTRSVVLAGSANQAEPARLVRNDVALPGHDADRDGLGTELEAALGTCAMPADVISGVPCRDHADLRDTDGDGLADGLEAVGGGTLPLPRWGANPRHNCMPNYPSLMNYAYDSVGAGFADGRAAICPMWMRWARIGFRPAVPRGSGTRRSRWSPPTAGCCAGPPARRPHRPSSRPRWPACGGSTRCSPPTTISSTSGASTRRPAGGVTPRCWTHAPGQRFTGPVWSGRHRARPVRSAGST